MLESRHKSNRLRRRNSLPANRASSLLFRLSSSKSNPYVGTFRHAPPSFSSKALREHQVQFRSSLQKTSPYVGSFRHAPSTCTTSSSPWLEEVCRLLLIEELMMPSKMNGVLNLAEIISGRLLGGGGADYFFDLNIIQGSFPTQRSKSDATVSALELLSRFACWLLMPFQNEPNRKPLERLDEASSVLTDSYASEGDRDEDDDDDDASRCMEETNMEISERAGLNLSVISSQAEAYYAHQAATILLQEHNDQSSLDYTISQMDVVRMMRNASRHLDVESIVQLPVITYHKQEPLKSQAPLEDPSDMSWLLVHKEQTNAATDKNGQEANSNKENDEDMCVICLENFCNGDRLRVLPCNHCFHVGCIDRWLSGSHSCHDCFTVGCPTCKKRPDILPDETVLDGSVPSWAFARIGDALARSSGALQM